jgi:hypothetical protein
MSLLERLVELRDNPKRGNNLTAAINEAIAELDSIQNANRAPEVLDLNGKRIILLTPIYRALSGRTFFTLWRCFGQYGPDKIGLIPEFQTVIHEARNMLASKFLGTDSEWCIMVDDDMVLPCGSAAIINNYFNARLPTAIAGYNAIQRIMSHPADKLVVGALYFVKGNPSTHAHKLAGRAVTKSAFMDDSVNRELHNPSDNKELLKDDWVGLGFSRIHRSVFEKIKEVAPGRFPEIMPTDPKQHVGWFQPIAPNVNEDISFCRRCRACGIDLWLDRSLVCGHADGTTVYWAHNSQ